MGIEPSFLIRGWDNIADEFGLAPSTVQKKYGHELKRKRIVVLRFEGQGSLKRAVACRDELREFIREKLKAGL